MNIDTNDLINVTEIAKRGVSAVINEVAGGRHFVVLNNSRPVAAIVDISTMERLQKLDEREEDLRLLAVASARMATDSGRRTSLRDVAAQLGVDLDSLGEDED
jgi:antitoxin (DNA-binding transcriptional repressor) of toxin-antitoxin stability system